MARVIDLSSLGAELKKALKVEQEFIKENAEVAVKVAAIKTFSKIIKMTPVDTGRARGNWFIGLSVGTELYNKKVAKGPAYVIKSMPDKIMGKKTYLYNNLPYIERLEFGGYGDGPKTTGGFSTQAPAGMVRISLLGWNSALKKAFKALKWHT